MQQGRDLGHVIVWQYIIFGYNEHEVDRAIEMAKEENFALLFVKTNRGFNPNNVLYRKNIDFKISSPSQKNRTEYIKGEFWGNETAEFLKWRKNRLKLKNR
jgi:hypothetical protein